MKKSRLSAISTPSPKGILTTILLILLLLQIYHLYSGLYDEPFGFVDETRWLQSAHFYYLYFNQRDFFNKDWYTIHLQDHPPVGGYILGLALDVVNNKQIKTIDGLNKRFIQMSNGDWTPPLYRKLSYKPRANTLIKDADDKEALRLLGYCNLITRNLSTDNTTKIGEKNFKLGRKVIFMFVILTVLSLIAVCYVCFRSLFVGLLASMLLLTNNLINEDFPQRLYTPVFQLAYVEAICSFFSLLSLLILIALLKKIRDYRNISTKGNKKEKAHLRKYILLLSLFEGIILAFGIGVKMTVLYMFVTVIAVLTISAILQGFNFQKKKYLIDNISLHLTALLAICIVTITIFLLLNPYFWPDPIGNTLKMVEFRNRMMEVQRMTQPLAIESFPDRIETLYTQAILIGYDLGSLGQLVYLVILSVGFFEVLRRAYKDIKNGAIDSCSTLLIWTLLTFTINGAIVHMKWGRYYIPFLMCTAIILSVGVEQSIQRIISVVEDIKPMQKKHHKVSRHS